MTRVLPAIVISKHYYRPDPTRHQGIGRLLYCEAKDPNRPAAGRFCTSSAILPSREPVIKYTLMIFRSNPADSRYVNASLKSAGETFGDDRLRKAAEADS